MRRLAFGIWPCLFIGQLLATSLLAWHLLAQVNFAYPLGYQLLDLDKHIAEFAPTNRYKHQFEQVSPKEHWRLFSEITDAVQHHGKNLESISYQLPDGTNTPLMHAAEITHLTDVSHLIDRFYLAGYLGTALWLIAFAMAYNNKMAFPSTKNILLGFCGSLFILTTLILISGPTTVFYWFHTKVFPDGHQWFFYYDESLMTTLMKAPDIFAFIAILLVSLLVIFWCGSTWLMARLLNNNKVAITTQTSTSTSTSTKKHRKK